MSQCWLCNKSSAITHCWWFNQESKFLRNSFPILSTILVHCWKYFHHHSLWKPHFYLNLLMTKPRFAFCSFTGGIQYIYMAKDDKWHWAAKIQHSKSRIRQTADSERPHKHSKNTKRAINKSKAKIAAYTFLCMPLKLLVTLRLPKEKSTVDCWKRHSSQFCCTHSPMEISG